MIPFEIEYIRPATLEDAGAAYAEATADGRSVRYLSGGTELVTMARDGKLRFDTLIDLKRIPETTVVDEQGMTFGACLKLSTLTDRLPAGGGAGLLRRTAHGVADRTTRNSITLGGNICGMLPYRETLLPFLLFDGSVEICGPHGRRKTPVAEIFDKRLKLAQGEFVVSLELGPEAAELDGFYQRKTRDPRIDYPLVTLCMAGGTDALRFAVSGAFGAPSRNEAAEQALNRALGAGQSAGEAAEAAAAVVDGSFRSDMRGSAEYRRALLIESLIAGIEELGGTG